jgi:hypothetical protein
MSSDNNMFDPTRFAVPDNTDTGEVGVKKVITKIDVRRPNRQEFFRAHPTLHLKTCVVEVTLAMSRDTYLIDPSTAQQIPGDFKVRNLTLCQNRQEGLFLWPVPAPETEAMTNKWHTTAVKAAEKAQGAWIRMVADMIACDYNVFENPHLAADPVWPDFDMPRVLELAFGADRIISSASHPIVRQLLGLE